jgi:hypothetical protein
MEKMNKKGIVPILGIIWGVTALAAAIGGLILIAKPRPATSPLFASIPIWGWIVMILVLLVLLRRR